MAERVHTVQDAVLAHRRAAQSQHVRRALVGGGGKGQTTREWTGCSGDAWRVTCDENGAPDVSVDGAPGAAFCGPSLEERARRHMPQDSALASHAVRAAKLRTLGERGAREDAKQRAKAIHRRDAKCDSPPAATGRQSTPFKPSVAGYCCLQSWDDCGWRQTDAGCCFTPCLGLGVAPIQQ